MRGRAVGGAFEQFLDKLSEGDPVALALAGFVGLLAVAAFAIWIVDRRKQQKEEAKAKGASRKR
jgi:uncharacterized membrane protein